MDRHETLRLFAEGRHMEVVPKGRDEHLTWRMEVLDLCRLAPGGEDEGRAWRGLMWGVSRRDVIFWLNTFVWIHEPMYTGALVPFNTWGYQDETVRAIGAAIGKEDIGLVKSRDMGASWMILAVLLHRWMFYDMQNFMVASRKEELVDSPEDPSTLFWKLDCMINNLPEWMKPRVMRQKLLLANKGNRSVFTGESTNNDLSRAGRLTALMLDEFGSVKNGREVLSASQASTLCRIFVGTPKGSNNAFYDIMHNENLKKIELHWSQHPLKNVGMRDDPNEKRGKWSPWFEKEKKRAGHPVEIAQELEMDWGGSDYQFFREPDMQMIREKYIRAPMIVGELGVEDRVEDRFVEQEHGRFRIWSCVGEDGIPVHTRRYVVGGDIGLGTGASNSVLVVVDCTSKEKVLEFASPNISPQDLAKLAIKLCNLFRTETETELTPAKLIWEANGPGRTFGKEVWEQGFRNVYYRENEKSVRGSIADMVPGWYSTVADKMVVLTEYRSAMLDGSFIERSKLALDECLEYVYDFNGGVVFSRSRSKDDPTKARENHGDRVIATALAFKLSKSKQDAIAVPKETAPKDSMGWRREQGRRDGVLAGRDTLGDGW